MNENIKTILMYFIRIFLSPLKMFKIKKIIMFCSNSGKSYSCNPKYIYEYICENNLFNNYKMIWTFEKPEMHKYVMNERTVLCRYRSLKYYYYKIVSKIYISNSIEGNETPKKRNQIRIQTWHGGGCYKRVGLSEKKKSKLYKKRTIDNINNTNLFLSSSELFSKNVIIGDFNYKGKILNSGMPRNDIIINNNDDIIRNKVCKEYNISTKSFIVMYAPTWRYDASVIEPINVNAIIKTLEKKYNKKVVFFYREHLHMIDKDYKDIINVTKYEDMQELLIATDMLISDYSSSIWDYSFSFKPCILYCPDLDYYIKNRGFVKDINEWGFPIAKNNKELIETISKLDINEYKKAMINHHNDLKSYENGNACEKIVKYLEKMLR